MVDEANAKSSANFNAQGAAAANVKAKAKI